jgi:hypothetical protein
MSKGLHLPMIMPTALPSHWIHLHLSAITLVTFPHMPFADSGNAAGALKPESYHLAPPQVLEPPWR